MNQSEETLVAGVDEVGRGALFGPVVAGAVLIPASASPQLTIMGVKDSKKLTHRQRVALIPSIEQLALDFQIGLATAQEIDQFNILQASLLAMKRAILRLEVLPDLCLIDGKQQVPHLPIPQKTIISGDETSPVISAASIIAKVWRDQVVVDLAKKYPQYDLISNKGYGTKLHRLALQKYGASREHRRSFRPCQVKSLD